MWLALTALALGGCVDPLPMLVPAERFFVGCETDEDCPRELPVCQLHEASAETTGADAISWRQCSRPCDPLI